MSKQLRCTLILILTGIIWGASFTAQSLAGSFLDAASLNTVRFYIGALVLAPFVLYLKKRDERNGRPAIRKKTLFLGAFLCGLFLWAGSTLQQIGINLGVKAGKAGFITTLYIVIIPIIAFLLFRKKCPLRIWICIGISLVGLYFLCIGSGFRFERGDLFILACAFAFASQVISNDHFLQFVDPLRLSMNAFLVCGSLSLLTLVFTEILPKGVIAWAGQFREPALWAPLLFVGIMSTGVAYTLQAVGQSGVPATLASLLLSLESVFAVFFGWLILNQKMTMRESIGSVLLFSAVIAAQLGGRKTDG